jgi:hypothetical protein
VAAGADARGGAGGAARGNGSTGAQGGTAQASARAVATGSGTASASAEAIGGQGGVGLLVGGRGGDVELVDAVSGSTLAGQRLDLRQVAGGGNGATSLATGGAGGDAVCTLDVSNPGGGDLRVELFAEGGRGAAGTTAGAAGTARIAGSAVAEGDVLLYGQANGGLGVSGVRVGSAGGAALVDGLFGRSLGGGEVRVIADARGGDSLFSGQPNGALAAGASVDLVDAVDGETSGALFLEQYARAGAGLASAAHARSSLTRAVSAASAAATVGAVGADASGADGGDGVALVDLANDAGAVTASATALGGQSNEPLGVFLITQAQFGDGGAADATARGRTSGDGHAVSVTSTATGGRGAPHHLFVPGRGGAAGALAEGVALGDSAVTVTATATGGSVGGGRWGAGTGAAADATAEAFGSNEGASAVTVTATATGGVGGGPQALPGTGTARARGTSVSGDVRVSATSIAGGVLRGASVGTPGAGLDISVVDAVSGSTAGRLTLEQVAVGGDGAPGGAASSRLSAQNPGGGALEALAEAVGGDGFDWTTGNPRDGGAALAAVHAEGEGEVTATARAQGGEGWANGSDGGTASIESAYGRSHGGERVHVTAWATGGMAGFGEGAGASTTLVDVVDGDTSGQLLLTQIAEGGLANGHGYPASAGTAGDATSVLRRTKSVGRLSLTSIARPDGGAGGAEGADADAVGEAENLLGGVDVVVLARGGEAQWNRGGPGARGGDASAEAIAQGAGDGEDVTVGTLGPIAGSETGACGGRGGVWWFGDLADATAARGGHATSRSEGRASGDSAVLVLDHAVGGQGGTVVNGSTRRGGAGGDASSSAFGENHGASAVRVIAEAIAGAGGEAGGGTSGGVGTGGAGGRAAATAEGHSASGDVEVTALQTAGDGGHAETGAAGADTEMIDAVSGSTAGHLTLRQEATAGDAGTALAPGNNGRRGGDARSTLAGANDAAGALTVAVLAHAGDGGRSYGGVAGAGGDAHAEASGADEAGAALRVVARAEAGAGGGADATGFGGTGGTGGAATLAAAGHSSAGGDVVVVGEAFGGAAGRGITAGGAGGDALLHDAVTGSTSGRLVLAQRAVGGSGAFRDGPWGIGSSALGWAGAAHEVTLRSEAAGRLATATIDARNSAGDVDARALAVSFGASEANVDVYAEAQQDGAQVTVGAPGPPLAAPHALAHGARGDVARSRSVGVHLGDGAVTVFDTAIGDDAERFQHQPPPPVHGDAFSTAIARNAGTSEVFAQSDARGGVVDAGAFGGNATAESEASGLGEVSSTALATRSGSAQHGVAQAHALASGASGSALALAQELLAFGPSGVQLLATRAGAEVSGSVGVAASVRQGTLAATEAGFAEAQLAASALPDAAALAAQLADDAHVLGALGAGSAAAHAALAFEHLGQDDSPLVLDAGLELWYSRAQAGALRLGFLDVEVLDGFGSLTVRIEDGGKRTFTKRFTRAEKLAAYFDDRVLRVKPAKGKRGDPAPGVLQVFFEAELRGPGGGLSLDFVVLGAARGALGLGGATTLAGAPNAVPEPRLLALAALLSCALCASRTRRR